jgi:transposase
VAKPVTQITLGIDVAKDQLVVRNWADPERRITVENDPRAIRAWLRRFHGPVRIALEPTSTYHLACVDEAFKLGIEVYLVGPRQLAHYREAVGQRPKTDPDDAYLLARYLAHEGHQLRRYQPRSRQEQQLWTLLKRRGALVQIRQQLEQSLTTAKVPAKGLFRELAGVIERLERRLKELVRALGWWADYQRCRSIPGVGAVNAIALTGAYHRGEFANADAFIAYLGLDVRVRDSGTFKGRRKLTKRGEAELRRLNYCAAKPSRCHRRFDAYYQNQLAKGLSKTAANVILGRKLARIAFSLIRNQQFFDRTIQMHAA